MRFPATWDSLKLDVGAKKTESRLFPSFPGELRFRAASWTDGVTDDWIAFFPGVIPPSEGSKDPSFCAGNWRTTSSGDSKPRLSANAGVLFLSGGDRNIVVLGMGVILREFGVGVSTFERYFSRWIGVLSVFDAVSCSTGLITPVLCSSGVWNSSSVTERSVSFVPFSSLACSRTKRRVGVSTKETTL